jgi:hypothetical protein
MLKIEHDIDAGPAEISEAVETDGVCEDCETEGLVIVWTSKISGMTYSVCRACLAVDEFARLVA